MKKSSLVISVILSCISIFVIGVFIFFDRQRLEVFLDIFPFILLLLILFFSLYFQNIYKNMRKEMEQEVQNEKQRIREENELKLQQEEEEKRKLCPYVVKSELRINSNGKTVWLIDYENCAYLPKEIDKNDVCYVFLNKNQENRFDNEISNLDTSVFVQKVVNNKTGKNLADIKIGLYVGMICSLYTPKELNIVSKDNGFDTVINSCNDMGINIIKNYNPKKKELVSEAKCKFILKEFKKQHKETEMSVGNMRKKLKNKFFKMSVDEINYVINKLDEIHEIEIVQGKDGKIVKLR